jgi:hypothetical protein
MLNFKILLKLYNKENHTLKTTYKVLKADYNLVILITFALSIIGYIRLGYYVIIYFHFCQSIYSSTYTFIYLFVLWQGVMLSEHSLCPESANL